LPVQNWNARNKRLPTLRHRMALQGKEALQYWDKVQGQIRDLNLTEYVHCTGYIDAKQASRYLSGSDLGVLPFNPGISLKSGSLLAMLAHRLPTIATCTLETDQVLTEKRVVDPVTIPRNAKVLAEAIHSLLENPAEQKRLAEAGYRIVQSFTWDSIANQHQEIYQQLLGE
jgi:glycosyltransferase involved in cell wall biosynthesis